MGVLRTLRNTFKLPVGYSDHTIGWFIPIMAVSFGAIMIEKHFTLSRKVEGPDSTFSLEPDEFKAMVEAIRIAEKALGSICYNITERQRASSIFRRSLFVLKNMKKGEHFTTENVKSIRPGFSLHTRHLKDILGRCAKKNIDKGTPLVWKLIM